MKMGFRDSSGILSTYCLYRREIQTERLGEPIGQPACETMLRLLYHMDPAQARELTEDNEETLSREEAILYEAQNGNRNGAWVFRILSDLGVDMDMFIHKYGNILAWTLVVGPICEEAVQFLIQAGTDPTICMLNFSNSETPYDVCRDAGNTRVLAMIDEADKS